MSDQLGDTTPEAHAVWLEAQRHLSPKEKLLQVFEMNELLRRLAEADVRRRYPNASDREVFLRVLTRRLGPELMRQVYGWEGGY